MDKKKILLIEDDAGLRKPLTEKLSQEGFEVLEATDGDLGLELAFSEHPDLILLDIVMPNMDGIAMAKRLRDDRWGKDVPVIIISNLSGMEKVEEVLKIGIFDYLVKSDVSLADIVQKVRELLTK